MREHDYEMVKTFYPKYFVPALYMFPLPFDCPIEIKTLIIQAFALYWTDMPSCVGKLRVALERLMDYYKISKTQLIAGKTKNRRGKRTLPNRIELFSKTHSEEGMLLLAIKWIGNEGAHAGELIDKDVMIDTFAILELGLKKLFDKSEVEVTKLAGRIVKRKGPIKK